LRVSVGRTKSGSGVDWWMVELGDLLVFFPFHLEAVKFYSTLNNIKEIFHLQTILGCSLKWLEPFPVFFGETLLFEASDMNIFWFLYQSINSKLKSCSLNQ